MSDPRGIRQEPTEQQKEAIAAQRRQAELFSRVFSTSDGVAVLNELSAIFENRSLLCSDAHEMHYRSGQRDVITWLRNMTAVVTPQEIEA